jgi:peptidoglycan/LPS O-acetylase OafA/YrhL
VLQSKRGAQPPQRPPQEISYGDLADRLAIAARSFCNLAYGAAAMGVVAKTVKSARMFELDAVRGIASLVVVFDHFGELFYRRRGISIDDPVSLLKATPFGVLVQGSSAVITFFVLSGFVLSIPFRAEDHSISWPRFVCKRILRLYLPFLVALAIASAADSAFSTHGIPTLNEWFSFSRVLG